MKWGGPSKEDSGDRAAKIKDSDPILSARGLLQLGDDWYATVPTQGGVDTGLVEELDAPERYPEGARKMIIVNAVERSAKARTACIRHHGLDCVVCGFNFEKVYGALGEDFIHVHHLVPVTSVRGGCAACPALPGVEEMGHGQNGEGWDPNSALPGGRCGAVSRLS